MSKFKTTSISLSPNVQRDDVVLALKLLFQPWKWKNGSAIKKLEEEFKKYLGVKYAVSFNSGRSSLYVTLKALDLPQGSNIMIQAFTCNAVPNPVLWASLNPIYIDCADNFNVDINKLKLLLEAKSYKLKAIVVQHTFGLPANMAEVMKITKENNMIVIEDCAHALGAEINGKPVGTFGDAAFFSFSRDKVISCVYGGMAVTNNPSLAEKLRQAQDEFGAPNLFWIFQQLLHPILLHFFILPLYEFLDLGKIFLVFSQWLHLLSKAVSWKEKRGLRPNYFPKALPNALAELALNQFKKLDTFNAHRNKIAEFYYQELAGTKFILPTKENNIFLRFAVQHPRAHEIIYEAWHGATKNIRTSFERDKSELDSRRKESSVPVAVREQRSNAEDSTDLSRPSGNQKMDNFVVIPPRRSAETTSRWQALKLSHFFISQNGSNVFRGPENILLGDWYTTPIAPDDTKIEEMKYVSGSCPNAERLSKITLNLPTHINISMNDAKRIVNFLKKYK